MMCVDSPNESDSADVIPIRKTSRNMQVAAPESFRSVPGVWVTAMDGASPGA